MIDYFDLPTELCAVEPPEQRGLARDQVRLLVAQAAHNSHARFADLPCFLSAGDLLVVNTSAALAADVTGQWADGRDIAVRFSAMVADGTWLIDLLASSNATPVHDPAVGDRIALPAGATVTLLGAHAVGGSARTRLWRADVENDGSLEAYLARHGGPSYASVRGRWPISAYRTVFGRDPGSAEMPSAGRPFTADLVASLVSAGVGVVPVTLHTAATDPDRQVPCPEWFQVPEATARLVNVTKAWGGRVVAVGTTAARALETVACPDGRVVAATGWTDLVLGPHRQARVIDGLITGWHPPGASHLLMLEAVAGADLVAGAYREALSARYLWDGFGDSCLFLPPRRRLRAS